ncbi:hypothetical protein [Pontibacter liquoris]|uniref:hypothetical protein n=1 Tax=Pontibacter liquoris TaxID=2905677 RepID=UPI001FA8126B|nr:hypothetical protein [Pontibacter liquoris]
MKNLNNINNGQTANESLSLVKHPLAINFDCYNLYNKHAFNDWATVILFETIAWNSGIDAKEVERIYIFNLIELVNSTGLLRENCKEGLRKLIRLGIVIGSAFYEGDFLEDDFCTGYYELDYDRVIQLLPYILVQPKNGSEKKRYKKITKYFKSIRNSIREFSKEEA